jgi:hypothetical protein
MISQLMLLVMLILASCTTPPTKPLQYDSWADLVQKEIKIMSPQLIQCGKWLELKMNEEISVSAFIRIHPTGKLENLVLSESQRWGKQFYECIYNQIDQTHYSSYAGEASVEIEQPLIFKKMASTP